MKRADIRKIFPDATEEQIAQMLTAIHGEVDAIKDEADNLRGQLATVQNGQNDEAKKWKDKYEAEHSAYEAFKNEQATEKTRGTKRAALKELLKDSGFSEKGQEKVLKYANLDEITLTEEGKIKDASKLKKSLTEEWSEYVTATEQNGHKTEDPDGQGVGRQSGGMTKEDIFKIADTAERQKAIAENISLFQ